MTLKIIGHIFYTTSSFVHYFKSIRKRPILVKIDDILAVWPWNLMADLENQ